MARLATEQICEKLKRLGYARASHIKLYGEQFQLVSDPFPHETGIAVQAAKSDGKPPRTVKLPLPILKMAEAGAA
jgi:hypothetical protein